MNKSEKPFAPACERNQEVLLATLKKLLRSTDRNVLEVGSGTGQHAVYFGQRLTQINWQTADVKDNHSGIQMWLAEAQLSNVLPPVNYTIGRTQFPDLPIDVVFSANTLHIISEQLISTLIQDLGQQLRMGSRVIFYGPFKYGGDFTAESNAEFDLWLKDTDTNRGIRDFEKIVAQMAAQAFVILDDISMPANNQLLMFEKK